MTAYLSRTQCEEAAGDLLVRYQRQVGRRLSLPVDVDLIGELTCGLTWDWEPLDDVDGHSIWARLVPGVRRVEMNERFARDLARNEGLDRFTRGHEIGHWCLHATHPLPDQLALFPLNPPVGDTVFCRGGTDSWQEKQADWFAAALLMPADLFLAAVQQGDLTRQEDRAALRDTCNVSWAALSIRLKTLGVPHLERGGHLWTG